MIMTNIDMFNRLNILQSISSKVTGKLGYAVARNIRKIIDECQDFLKIKDELVHKYGTEDENGNIVIKQNTEEYENFIEELQVYSDIQCDVDIFKVNEEELWNSALNANEMLSIEFMIDTENYDKN